MKRYILTICICALHLLVNAQDQTAIISGHLSFLKEKDTISLTLYQYGELENINDFQQTFKTVCENGRFEFRIPVAGYPQSFDLRVSGWRIEKNLNAYQIERQDSVDISETDNTYHFDGRGAEKMNLYLKMKAIDFRFAQLIKFTDKDHFVQDLAYSDSSAAEQLRLLNLNRSSVSGMVYRLLQAKVIQDNMGRRNILLPKIKSAAGSNAPSSGNPDSSTALILAARQACLADSSALVYADYFAETLVARYQTDSCLLKNAPFDLRTAYAFFKNNYTRDLRDKLLTVLLFDARKSPDAPALMQDAMSLIKVADFNELFTNILKNEVKGAEAFEFSLTDKNGKLYQYSDFKGKVVLLDFWFTGCSACKKLKPVLATIEEEFKGKPVVFLSISIDKKRDVWINSLKKGEYTGPGSINLYTSGLGNTHPVISNYHIIGYPTLILIGKNGKLTTAPALPTIDNGIALRQLLNEQLAE